jgi:multicomponent Na+:H+ antiporter subunit B
MTSEAAVWLLIALAVAIVALAIALVRVRALFAMAALLACLSLCATLALAAFDAPDVALIQAGAGLSIIAPLFLGAAMLIGRSATVRSGKFTLGVGPVAAVLVAIALAWAIPDLPVLGDKGPDVSGAVYVHRAVGEAGLLNAVTAVSANYRAIDSLLAAGAVFVAALGVYALLGFGERSILRTPAAPRGDGA